MSLFEVESEPELLSLSLQSFALPEVVELPPDFVLERGESWERVPIACLAATVPQPGRYPELALQVRDNIGLFCSLEALNDFVGRRYGALAELATFLRQLPGEHGEYLSRRVLVCEFDESFATVGADPNFLYHRRRVTHLLHGLSNQGFRQYFSSLLRAFRRFKVQVGRQVA